jgi:hypothetical protein
MKKLLGNKLLVISIWMTEGRSEPVGVIGDDPHGNHPDRILMCWKLPFELHWQLCEFDRVIA